MKLPWGGQNRRHLVVKLSAHASQTRCRKYLSPSQTTITWLVVLGLILRLRICHADLRCDHDDLAGIQYSEAATTLAYDEAQSTGQGSVFTQVLMVAVWSQTLTLYIARQPFTHLMTCSSPRSTHGSAAGHASKPGATNNRVGGSTVSLHLPYLIQWCIFEELDCRACTVGFHQPAS